MGAIGLLELGNEIVATKRTRWPCRASSSRNVLMNMPSPAMCVEATTCLLKLLTGSLGGFGTRHGVLGTYGAGFRVWNADRVTCAENLKLLRQLLSCEDSRLDPFVAGNAP